MSTKLTIYFDVFAKHLSARLPTQGYIMVVVMMMLMIMLI
jgi:hypothetical protein